MQSPGYSNLHKIQYIGLSPSGKATDYDSVTRGFESRQPSHEKSTRKRAFLGEVRLSAREVMLRIVKLLRSEFAAEAGGTLHFILCQAQYFTAALPLLHLPQCGKLQ